jgi:hypothetical protein
MTSRCCHCRRFQAAATDARPTRHLKAGAGKWEVVAVGGPSSGCLPDFLTKTERPRHTLSVGSPGDAKLLNIKAIVTAYSNRPLNRIRARPQCNTSHIDCEFHGGSTSRDCCCNVSCNATGCSCTTSCNTSCLHPCPNCNTCTGAPVGQGFELSPKAHDQVFAQYPFVAQVLTIECADSDSGVTGAVSAVG